MSEFSPKSSPHASPTQQRKGRPGTIRTEPVMVSRHSGLDVSRSKGTFGRDARFADQDGEQPELPPPGKDRERLEKQKERRDKAKIAYGSHSPWKDNYYRRNQLYKTELEKPSIASTNPIGMGIGERPGPAGVTVADPRACDRGPGSYDTVGALSAAKSRSPLDGTDYCNTTIKIKLGSSIMPSGFSPGPKYNVRTEDLSAHLPDYGKHWDTVAPEKRMGRKKIERMSHGTRHVLPGDVTEGPGPGAYHNDSKCISASVRALYVRDRDKSHSASSPDLPTAGSNCREATGGTKRCVKSTFGLAERFPAMRLNCSPKGDLYYSHNKFRTADDYLNDARTCGMGGAQRTDFANPHRDHVNTVSPHTYQVDRGYSATMRTSPIDGLVERLPSPTMSSPGPGSRRRGKSLGATSS